MFPSGPTMVGVSYDSKFLYLVENKKTHQEELSGPVSSETLKRAFEKGAIRSKNIVVALPSSESLARYFEIPHIPKKELASAIRFEAQKYLPFELKDLLTDYQTFPNRFQKIFQVVFLAAKKETVENLKKIFLESGLRPVVMEPAVVSLVRACPPLSPKTKGEVRAVISVHEDGGLDLAIEKNKLLLMTRSSHLTNGETSFEEFLKEINLSFNYFTKNFKTEEIKQIILIADSKTHPKEWADGLKTQFEIPVTELAMSPGLAAAVGAALAEPFSLQDLGHKRPNLLAEESAAKGDKVILPAPEEMKILKKWALIDMGIMVVLILAIHLFLVSKLFAARNAIIGIEKTFQVTPNALPTQTLNELDAVRQTLEKKAAYLSIVIGQRICWTEKLDGIAHAAPREIQLTRLEASDAEITGGASNLSLMIQGVTPLRVGADEMSTVKQFVDDLRHDPHFIKGFDSVKISNVRKETAVYGGVPVMSFTIECSSVRRPPGA